MNGPKLMCCACGEVEVGIYSPVCCDCERAMQQEWDLAREQEMRDAQAAIAAQQAEGE